MSGFTFNNSHSKSKYIKSIKSERVLVAGKKHTTISIPASDNVILIPDNSKSPFILPIECLIHIPFNKSIFDVGRELESWLTTSDWSKLIFDDDPNYYFEAICMTEITVTELRDATKNTITLEFYCKPTQKAVR